MYNNNNLIWGACMEFPIIYTNVWDLFFGIPLIFVLTQFFKTLLPIKPIFVPNLAIVLGLVLSIFISHRYNIFAGLFMGWFYGYGAISTHATLKTSLNAYRKQRKKKLGHDVNGKQQTVLQKNN